MSKHKTTDECMTQKGIQAIHDRLSREGIRGALNDLAEREPALAAYIIYCGHCVAQMARSHGAPPEFVEWIDQEVQARMLVSVEAQREAHYELWRDVMGDEPEPTGGKEDHHGSR